MRKRERERKKMRRGRGREEERYIQYVHTKALSFYPQKNVLYERKHSHSSLKKKKKKKKKEKEKKKKKKKKKEREERGGGRRVHFERSLKISINQRDLWMTSSQWKFHFQMKFRTFERVKMISQNSLILPLPSVSTLSLPLLPLLPSLFLVLK